MRKYLISLCIATLLSIPAFADQVVLNDANLSEAQFAQIKADIAKLSAENIANKESSSLGGLTKDPAKMMSVASTFGTQAAIAAKGFAEAIGIAAHELGVSVNEFIGTPAGKLTVAIIIWKVAGATLLHAFGALFAIVVSLTFARKLWVRTFTSHTEIVDAVWLWGLYKSKKTLRIQKPFKDITSDDAVAVFIIIVCNIIAVIVCVCAL